MEDDYKKEMGQRVRDLRNKRKLSTEVLAKALGYPTLHAVNKWELGKSNIPAKKITELAQFFGVSESFIRTGIENGTKKIEVSDSMLEHQNKILEERNSFLLEQIEFLKDQLNFYKNKQEQSPVNIQKGSAQKKS